MSDRPAGLPEVARTFLQIGTIGFGGPAIIGIMQAELQEKRAWLTRREFLEGLSLGGRTRRCSLT
jgi:chromate transporter